MSEQIDDAVKGVAWVNKNIAETEMAIALVKKKIEEDPTDGDALKALSRLEYTKLKWGELLQKWTYQKFQTGKDEEDITKGARRKVRVQG